MRVIDLSQEISSDTQVFPAYPRLAILTWTKRETFGFESEAMFLITHTGTHLDAPYHFDAKGWRVNEVPVERLVRDAVLLDLSRKRPRELIEDEDLEGAEERAGLSVREGEIVILRTGWEKRLGKPEYLKDYPGLSASGAEFLAAKGVSAVGVDSPNLDHPDASDFPAHNLLLSRGILIVENLVNLDALKSDRFRFIALPLKIRGATGSPVRAVAVEE